MAVLRAMQRRRVESLVLGALSSSPVHRALVLGVGTNIAVLLGCSKSSRQCDLYYLLTYSPFTYSIELDTQSQLSRAEETYAKRGKRGQPPPYAERSRGGAVEGASVGGRVVLVGGLVEDGLGRARPAPD